MIPRSIAETVVDPKAYADWPRIDEAYRWLRREAPLAWLEPEGYEPFWAVTRHADILAAERQNDLFHNGDKAIALTTLDQDAQNRAMNNGSPHQLRSLVHMDGPDHFAYRRIGQAAFVPQNLRRIEGRVREIARDCIARMLDAGGRCDFARDVAVYYPLRVIMELMGVPPEDEALMLRLTQESFATDDPDVNRSRAEISPVQAAIDLQKIVDDFNRYFQALTEDRRRCPRSDLVSHIANAEVHGQRIGLYEAMSYYILIATAGHDTTSNAISGGMWALAENPDQFAALKARPSLIAGHVEESIRWETPVKHFMRQATKDVEFAGQTIAKGDQLMLCYASGNRDEAVFVDPYRYDIARAPNKHAAFGYGVHVCLGQHLARMEMRIFWEELLPNLAEVGLDGKPSRSAANFVSGPKSLPIRYRLTARQ